jgi:hypothetical protein
MVRDVANFDMTIMLEPKFPFVGNDVQESIMLATSALNVCGRPTFFILPAHIVKHNCQ